MRIEDLALPGGIVRRLAAAGITETDELTGAMPREVLAIPGIGRATLTTITSALAAHGLHLAEDAYEPYVCARHGRSAHDVKLTDLWLCDECAEDFKTRPFGGKSADYTGSALGGYCANCVQDLPDVALRQWLLCTVCARVTQSFGQSVIASRELGRRWNAEFAGPTSIELVETDPPRLNRFDAPVRVAEKDTVADFEGVSTTTGQVVFGIEQKTGQDGLGPGAVNPMGQFQLDCSDCDDIAAVAESTQLPVFLVHAQAIQRALPPTRLWVPVGFWWTDAYAMGANCIQIRNRSREVRPAAYYPPRIFRPLADLAAFIEGGGVDEFARRVAADGRFPEMYPGQNRQTRSAATASASSS